MLKLPSCPRGWNSFASTKDTQTLSRRARSLCALQLSSTPTPCRLPPPLPPFPSVTPHTHPAHAQREIFLLVNFLSRRTSTGYRRDAGRRYRGPCTRLHAHACTAGRPYAEFQASDMQQLGKETRGDVKGLRELQWCLNAMERSAFRPVSHV